MPSAPKASLWKSRTGSVRPLQVLRSRSSTSVSSSPGGPAPGTKNSLAHSVYDQHQYADENKRVMEATAAKIMALVNVARVPARKSCGCRQELLRSEFSAL